MKEGEEGEEREGGGGESELSKCFEWVLTD